jgi:hypothetical protein
MVTVRSSSRVRTGGSWRRIRSGRRARHSSEHPMAAVEGLFHVIWTSLVHLLASCMLGAVVLQCMFLADRAWLLIGCLSLQATATGRVSAAEYACCAASNV